MIMMTTLLLLMTDDWCLMTDDDDAADDYDNHHEIFSQHLKLPPALPGRLLANDTAQQFSIDDEDLFWQPERCWPNQDFLWIVSGCSPGKFFSQWRGEFPLWPWTQQLNILDSPLDVQLSLYVSRPYGPMSNKIKQVYGWKKNKP